MRVPLPLHCWSLPPAILQLAVFHSVIHLSCCNQCQSLSHTASTYFQCRQEPLESEGPDWQVVWPPELLCWHVGRCTNTSPKAETATALLSVEILQAQTDPSKSQNHTGTITPPGTNLDTHENGFLYKGCFHHLTALCPWEREWKPAIVSISHWRVANIPCHLRGESQS